MQKNPSPSPGTAGCSFLPSSETPPGPKDGEGEMDDGQPLHTGPRHHVATGPAGAKILAVEEAGIGLGDGVATVIVNFGRLLVERRVAAGAEPLEAVDL